MPTPSSARRPAAAPLLTRTYLLPALLLNPVLLLHSLNTFIAHALPLFHPASSISPDQRPTSWVGAPPHKPALDMHASDQLCWSYTLVMVAAQLVAYGKVTAGREERREWRERERERLEDEKEGGNGWVKANGERGSANKGDNDAGSEAETESSDEGIAL